MSSARSAGPPARLTLQAHIDGRWVTLESATVGSTPILMHARMRTAPRADALRVVGGTGVTLRHLVVLGGH